MASKYCMNCGRVVEARRVIGVGTIILILITGLIWVIFIPFYSKRCPICKGTNFGSKPIDIKQPTTITHVKDVSPIEKIKQLQELKDAGAITEEEFNEKKKILLGSI